MNLIKYYMSFLVFLFLAIPTVKADAPPVTYDLMTNYFRINLPDGDSFTLYLSDNKTLYSVPSVYNKDYTQNCMGAWKFNEKKQTVKITGVHDCRFLLGEFGVTKFKSNIYLQDGKRRLILQRL